MNPRTSSVARYCATVLMVILAWLGVVAGINAIVDPFDMTRLVKSEGFNAYKPALFNRVRLYKAFEVTRERPQTLILGTSRTHLGLRCTHPALTRLQGPCYNLAFDGATAKEMYYYLRHAQAAQPLKHVILGLDNYHASLAPATTRPDFDPLLLHAPGTPELIGFLTGDLRVLTSLDTLLASISTVRSQDQAEPNWFAPDGQRLGEVFFHRAGENFMRSGPRAYFDEIDRLEVGYQTEGASAPVRPGVTTAPDPDQTSLAYIRRIVEFCRENRIDLRIFITPSHVHQLEIAAATGAGPSIENGKRALVRLLADDAAQHREQPTIPLIDFGGYSAITTEPLPAPGSRNELQFYWDSSHFKSIVGDYVLDRLFEIGSPPRDFGIALTNATIEETLKRQRSEQAAYRQRFPDEVAALEALVQTAMRNNTSPR
jgi:hypothetical protein